MSGELPNTDAEYLTKCRNTMRQKYGEPVYILLTQKGDPANYPNGAWFDAHVNEPMQIAGVDEDHIPPLYIMPNGEAVPFPCAELLSWIPPVQRNWEIVKMGDEPLRQKKLYDKQEIMAMLRLAFPDIPDHAELVISQSSPFLFADGAILWLQLYQYPIDDYIVEFVAGIHEVKGGKFCVVALDNGQGECITLTKKVSVS
jgi:hypothetical protein